MATIGIIDYRMGNLRSVQKALELLGARAEILTDSTEVAKVDRLILPGVGAFGDGMAHLREGGWLEPIGQFIAAARPMLGICLGMQLLFEGSEEDAEPGGLVPGLAVLGGKVVRFRGQAFGPGKLKVPHMGWNGLQFEPGEPMLAGLDAGAQVYFVHSYYAQPADASIIAARSEYGGMFCAAVRRGRLWATQFHPEKSQRVGMTILRNFIDS